MTQAMHFTPRGPIRTVALTVLLSISSSGQAEQEINLGGSVYLPLTLEQDQGVTISNDGTIHAAGPLGDDFSLQGFASNLDSAYELLVDDFYVASGGITFQDNYGLGAYAPSISVSGVDTATDQLLTEVTSLSPLEPFYQSDLHMAWEEVSALLDDKDCRIRKLSLSWQEIPTIVPAGADGIIGTDDDQTDFDPESALARYTLYSLFVHCDDRRNFRVDFVVSVKAFDPDQAASISVTGARLISTGVPGGKAATKGGVEPPIAGIPDGQSAVTLGLQAVTGYLGQDINGGNAVRPTLVWLNSDGSPQEVLQVGGPGAGFSSTLSLCGHPNFEHLWLAWTSDSGRAQLAYIRDRQASVMNLGDTGGEVQVDCDVWGNAAVAFANPAGSQIAVVSFNADGNQQDSASFNATDGFGGMVIGLDLNNNGEAVVAWQNPVGSRLRQVSIGNVVKVDMSFAGSWNSALYDGEGFIWDVAEVNGVPTLVLYYFSYRPNTSGRQAWMVGSAPIENGVAVIPAAITEGGTFGSAYDPDDVSPASWGEIEVRVNGCSDALMIMRSPSFGDHRYPIRKFTGSPIDLPGICANGNMGVVTSGIGGIAPALPKGSVIDGSYTGSWFSPQRNFEGFIFEVVNVGGTPTLVAYWFSYSTMGNGRQLWLVGTGEISGNSATVTLASTSGGRYGPQFDPNAVMPSIFGTVTVSFSDCDNATVNYQVNGGESGSFPIQRLAALPSNAGGACGG